MELEIQDSSETMVRASNYFPNEFKNMIYGLTWLTTVTPAAWTRVYWYSKIVEKTAVGSEILQHTKDELK